MFAAGDFSDLPRCSLTRRDSKQLIEATDPNALKNISRNCDFSDLPSCTLTRKDSKQLIEGTDPNVLENINQNDHFSRKDSRHSIGDIDLSSLFDGLP